ncbi:helix-turn-helix transcriptional regulator [Empedobacter brevis]|uniref:Helix-turn-helix transcriptional regulator n=1 Tax=Empedobacter brevis TaxID=247 RepID=A0AAJ1V7Y4_9FLAO|nr:helix-turn-helix domain-containing protein [Empedobacter brevis]MDM1072966.1 helix-turn-helix transcriptional regulator [Empedobacter brevis]QES91711.1 helix-turn-helix transcriptional regulator [Empedobacter brevis]QHC83482.1 HxlR family transcriptional regulator [Empedobacter brevis]
MEDSCNINYIKYKSKEYPCATSFVMDLIGGKWKTVILCQLKNKEKRFNVLRKELSFITESTLSLQLKQLEEDGLIIKTIYGEKPPLKVIYKLSELGASFMPILEELNTYGKKILKDNKF